MHSWKKWLLPLAGLLLTGVVQAAPNGAELFSKNCAVCHGENGDGGVGVPLSLPAFQSSVTDHYLETTIRKGRPGRVMPAFRNLSEAEVQAIIEHVRGWYDGERPTYTEQRLSGNAQHGSELFAQNCAACHGENGQGGKGTGVTMSRPRDLPIIAPALNNIGFLQSASDAMIKSTLEKGREGTPMVSFRDQGLSDADLNDLVAYIRSFEATAHDPAQEDVLEPILMYESPYSVEETVAAVKAAAVGKNFRLIRDQHLENGLFPEEEENPKQVISYFCNFNFLYEALAIDPRVGLFLPCRITVLEGEDGVVRVMSINPKRLSRLFNNNALDQACEQMYQLYNGILEEATL